MENQDGIVSDTTVDSADSMNQALRALYESRRPELVGEIEACIGKCDWEREAVSKLFLMNVEKEYVTAPTKILFVGRETCGWKTYCESDTVKDLMDYYKEISYKVEKHNSPFWRFRRDFSKEFDISDPDFRRATLWTNLSKIDVAKKRPPGPGFGDLSQAFIGLLIAEIEIVRPDVVLILTTDGHYTWHVNNYGWLRDAPFDAQKPAELTRTSVAPKMIDHLRAVGRLPEHTYQISHPNNLCRNPVRYSEIVKQLVELIGPKLGVVIS